MKRKFDHSPKAVSSSNGAPAQQEQLSGPKYWRSLDELADTPGFREQLAREFPQGASELEGVDRRHFMKIMAASFALGGIGLAGCRRPEMHILPFGKSVTGAIPGLPLYYATAMPLRKVAIPLLAETNQGRPTKIEGNPTDKLHAGSASLHAQASVLELYDPERATAHRRGNQVLKRAEVDAVLANINRTYGANGGEGLAFLAGESSSPTRLRLVRALRAQFPRATWAEYEPVQDEPPVEAARAAFGAAVKPVYHFERAKRIVSIDCDFLAKEAGHLYYARGFSNARRIAKKDDPMNRLYVAESALTMTGAMADHRLRLASSHMMAFAARLAAAIYPQAADFLAPFHSGLTVDEKWINECVADLQENRGSTLVVAGAHLPPEVHTIVYGINNALGAIGNAVTFVPVETAPGTSTITGLANAIKGGSVRTLVVLGGNPVYNAPADLDWASLQNSVGEIIRFGYYADETTQLAPAKTTHIAAAHYLESWGDARMVDGTIVPIQPMILPLFGGLTEIELLARILGEQNTDPYALVSATIAGLADSAGGGAAGNIDRVMQRFLHDGLLEGSAHRPVAVTFNNDGAGAILQQAQPKPLAQFSRTNLEVRFVNDHKVDDGRFANNGWLQECPDPMTKIAWDNAILVSPRLGKELGIDPKGSLIQVARKEEGEFDMGKEISPVFELNVGGRKVRGPVHIQPGLSNYTVVVALGYGRTAAGNVGNGAGFNAYAVRTTGALHVASGATLTATGESRKLANVQEHWSMEGRDIVREANLQEVQKEGGPGLAFSHTFGLETHSPLIYGDMTPEEFAKLPEEEKAKRSVERSTNIPRGNSLYSTPKFDGIHQWGMSIDMTTCIGCQACVVACQAENNVPIVGRDQVLRGREMHWLRIDRYYASGTIDAAAFGGEGNKELPEDPQVLLQPMTCVHCELAPCETVCPVNATVHDEEGLNVMAYNRCIGTRYCANNCPYKVRRFNFFDWNQRRLDELYLSQLADFGMPELVKMSKNPEVTVRMRGVMEKCTYCVQRVQNGKIQHKVKLMQERGGAPVTEEEAMVPDGTVKTACQQTCPVDAIVFGNIRDKNSAVVKAKAREQEYQVLGYLNTRPRTTFAGRVRNPNPRMPGYSELPYSRVEYSRKNDAGEHAGGHEEHGAPAHGEHGAPAPAHEAPKAEKASGHGALNAFKKFGGLS